MLAVAVLLMSSGGVGARQPAVRTAVPLPAPAAELARALDLSTDEPSRILLDTVRVLHRAPGRWNPDVAEARNRIRALLAAPPAGARDLVPLPLDPAVWRTTLLGRDLPEPRLTAAILEDRPAALLYHGLAALDDETLAWLGSDRALLRALRRRPGVFAAFGRSLRVHEGRVAVPGGREAEAVWQPLVGADPAEPGRFVRRLFRGDGRLAWMYDTLAHLDSGRQAFALAAGESPAARTDAARVLLAAFSRTAPGWRVDSDPFFRPSLDPPMVLAVIDATPDGRLAGPASRAIWEAVFRGDDRQEMAFREPRVQLDDEAQAPVDAAWLIARVAEVRAGAGRRRLETLLFAQRVFAADAGSPDLIATALRGYMAFPALMLTLERMDTREPGLFAEAARYAASLTGMRNAETRRDAIATFQSLTGILNRAVGAGGIAGADARALFADLLRIRHVPERTYAERVGSWIRGPLATALRPPAGRFDAAPMEAAVLRALAGPSPGEGAPLVAWEGRSYRVDPAGTELRRLRAVRERQGGPTLDETLDGDGLAAALTSILYAAHLGDPDGPGLAGGDPSARHDLFGAMNRVAGAWLLPIERFGAPVGWRVTGSLLGLEHALARLAVRRLDSQTMPPAPRLNAAERQTLWLTAALLRPAALDDRDRDRIAAALARGRDRLRALTGDRTEIEQLARDAGLSEWRREALAWVLAHDRPRVESQFSLLELLWLGHADPEALRSLDAWGAAALPSTGCVCLRMPAPRPWEEAAGRPSMGLLAGRSADVTLRIAEMLAERRLPASLAPAIAAYAVQDVADHVRLAYLEDWDEFGRVVLRLTTEQLEDYVAALTADGPLVPSDPASTQQ